MRKIASIQITILSTCLVTTIIVLPALTDPFNIVKLFTMSLGSLACIWMIFKTKNFDHYGLGKLTKYHSLALFAILTLFFLSDSDLYRNAFGTWGRNNGLIYLMCSITIFYSLSLESEKLDFKLLYKFLTYLGFVNGIVGILEFMGAAKNLWDTPASPIVLTLGNENFASSILAITSIATLFSIFDAKKKNLKFILLISFIVQIFLMYKSRSTQGLVIFAVAVSVLLTLIINENQKRKLTIINFAWLTSNLIIFTFAILSLFQVVKVTNILSKENGSFESRILHWKSAISMFVNNPITGVGVDSFGEFFPLHRFKFEDGRLDTYTNNAHNVFLQALATGGIILFSVYALTSLLTFKAIINIFRFTKIDLQIGVLIALYIAFTVQSLISIDQIGLAVWGWTFSGYLVAYENKLIKTKQKIKVNSKGTIKILSKFTYSITTLAISISLIPNLNSMLQIWEIRSTLNKIGNSEASISDVNRLYEIAVSYNEPSMRMQAVGGLLNLGMIDQALKLSLDSTKKFPKSVYAWDAVASIYEQTNRWNLAVSYRKESLRLDPQNIKMQELLISDQSKS